MKYLLSKLRVLIVDDQDDARDLLKDMLKEIGTAETAEAKDGQEALQFLSDRPGFADVILCDWNMPNMTGLDFLGEVRIKAPKTPFLMVTGRSDMDSVIRAKSLGLSAYIRKPFTKEQLEAKLRIVIQKKSAS